MFFFLFIEMKKHVFLKYTLPFISKIRIHVDQAISYSLLLLSYANASETSLVF